MLSIELSKLVEDYSPIIPISVNLHHRSVSGNCNLRAHKNQSRILFPPSHCLASLQRANVYKENPQQEQMRVLRQCWRVEEEAMKKMRATQPNIKIELWKQTKNYLNKYKILKVASGGRPSPVLLCIYATRSNIFKVSNKCNTVELSCNLPLSTTTAFTILLYYAFYSILTSYKPSPPVTKAISQEKRSNTAGISQPLSMQKTLPPLPAFQTAPATVPPLSCGTNLARCTALPTFACACCER